MKTKKDLSGRFKVGDIIEVITTDENGAKLVRRCRPDTLKVTGDIVTIMASNLNGEYPKPYRLPLLPMVGGVPNGTRNFAGWKHFDDSGEADE